jgi:acetolactate synthase I/III small subunit
VDDMTGEDHVERELALMKLKLRPAQRDAIRALVEKAGGRVLSDSTECHIVELTASEAEINALAQALAAQAELQEIVRSGALAVSRQARIIHVVES